jgi:hypothetical protein
MTSDSEQGRATAVPQDIQIAIGLSVAGLAIGALDFGLQRLGVSSVQSEALSSPASLLVGIAFTAFLLFLIGGLAPLCAVSREALEQLQKD